jgi:3-dehydroquinate synthase
MPIEHAEMLKLELGTRSYPIAIGAGLLEDGAALRAAVKASQVLIVTNEVVAPLYLEVLQRQLASKPEVLVLPDGEQHKTLECLTRIFDCLIAANFHRDACIVALGGGVIGDMAGFAAACYQRGIDYVQVPTTLLAQVDSSVGGKTAINHPRAKNMIGAFHQPTAVLIDTSVLRTLPQRELRAGLAEIIKYGLILDRDFFAWLESHIEALLALGDSALRVAIRRSCELKAQIVAEDEREQGRRALLNLGHTFGHALESYGRFARWLHGEAVALGIALAAEVSARQGLLSSADAERIDALLERAGLPTRARDIDVDEVLALMELDKKAGAKGLKLVLLESIGSARVVQSPGAAALRPILARRLAG